MIRLIKNIIKFDKKYEIAFTSAGMSFYVVLAIFSLLILGFQFYNLVFVGENNYLINNLYNIFNESIYNNIKAIIPLFTINSFSIILLFNLFWSSSKVLNGINKIADRIYANIKKRNGVLLRISSFLMFSMLTFIIIFEVGIVVITTNKIKSIIDNYIITRIIQFTLEVLIIFSINILLGLYAPPIKMNLRMTYKGAIVSTVLIYLLSVLIIIIITIFKKINIVLGILSVISFVFLWIYLINYFLITGIIINYINGKKRND